MKVGLFLDTFYPMVDGVIKVVDNYATRLAKKGEVVLFCPGVKGYDEAEDKKYPYEIVRCHSLPLGGLDYSLPLGSVDPSFQIPLSRSNVDLVHIHSPFTLGIAGTFYAKIHNVPLIATLHSQYRQDFARQLKLEPAVKMALSTVMMTFNACDECWAVNDAIKALYQKEYGLTAPCKVVQNATDHVPVDDPAAAAARVNERYGLESDDVVFLFVGRINFIKNIDFTVRALKILKDRGHKFKMLFVGQGQDERKLKELVESLDLQDIVIMAGLVSKREELQDLYSRAKLFLFPSLYDANSLVQIEAACQSTPSVFLKGARTAATVTDGVNAIVCEPTEESFAGRIEEVMNDEALYLRLSTAAHDQLYVDWDDVVDGVYEKYLEMVEAKKQDIEARKLSNRLRQAFLPDVEDSNL
ncbi:MAG: glycosyltransferase [Bacteroidales bacterium]|nr:glycosyltransferase [Bacteroidales bacterium]